MKKNNKRLKLFSLIFLILFCLYFQTVAYSAINSTMTIKGDAYARVDADVRITNFKLSSSSSNSTSSYEEFSVNTIASKFNLLDSSSSIVFDVEVTNYGSADVGILQLVGTVPTGLSCEIINYNLKDKICDDTGKCNQMAVKSFQIKFMGTPGEYEVNLELDFRTYHKVTYTDITNNNYPIEVIDGGNLNITFKEDLKRVSVLSNGVEVNYYNQISNGQTIAIENVSNDIEVKKKELVAKLVSGEIDEVGSEVCIKDECFYIISNDGSTVSMLSKYNLYVGGSYDGSTYTPYGREATGIQDSKKNGAKRNNSEFIYPFEGVTHFTDDSDLIYSGSAVEGYINDYVLYLKSLNAPVLIGRLFTESEISKLNDNTFAWVFGNSYWSTPGRYNMINVVTSWGTIDMDTPNQYLYGVRPVIEMSVDEIHIPTAKLVSGDIDTIGSEVCIKDECFYIISSDDSKVTMLAKYNLYVGGKYENNTWIAYGDEATGKQDFTMLGYVEGQNIRKGTTPFASTNYWSSTVSSYPAYVYDSNSTLYSYVENYKIYLSTLGVTPTEARLITYEELTSLGCSDSSCKNAPSWVYATSYWSGSANNTIKVWRVNSNDYFNILDYDNDRLFGVRPVIVISKSNF